MSEAAMPLPARMERVAAVDREAFFRELVPDLLRYFVSRLVDREDASDAAAETLLVLWKKERTVPAEPEDARKYAFGVARRVLSSFRRGERRRTALADRLRSVVREQVVPDPGIDVELRSALGELGEKDREIVLLVAWDGFSVADAGRVIGLRPEAARARYSRARARLRARLA